jgi:hypothetical protein
MPTADPSIGGGLMPCLSRLQEIRCVVVHTETIEQEEARPEMARLTAH